MFWTLRLPKLSLPTQVPLRNTTSTQCSGNVFQHPLRLQGTLLFLPEIKLTLQSWVCFVYVSCKLRPKFREAINSNCLAKSNSSSLGQLWMVKFIKSRPLASPPPLDAAVIRASLCQVAGSALKSPWHGFVGTYPSAAALFVNEQFDHDGNPRGAFERGWEGMKGTSGENQ